MKKIHVVLFLFILTACIGQEPSRENWLKNSANEIIYVQVEGYEHRRNKKIAFIQHGLASNLEHSAVQTAKKAFLDNGYLVIIFDSRYSMGKSDGEVINVRLATFKKDLETVINWAKKQNFYREPFILAGHSLGGASVLQYSAENASVIDAVIPITPVVSGVTWENSCMFYMPDFCKDWKKKGFYNYQPVVLPYTVVEEAKNYDALRLAKDIKARVLLITAEDDHIIAPQDVKALYQALETKKSLGIVSEGGHNFTTERSRQELYNSIAAFLS